VTNGSSPATLALALQPYGTSTTPPYDEVMKSTFADPHFKSISIASAWIFASGLKRFRTEVRSFRARGGIATAIAGLSLGGATREGLIGIMAEFDSAYVVYDTSGRTFHPKMMVATGPTSSRIFVGSQNITISGLARNFEAGICLTWSHPEGETPEQAQQILTYIRDLLDDEGICKRLTPELLEQIENDPGIALRSERFQKVQSLDQSSPSRSSTFGSSKATEQAESQPGTIPPKTTSTIGGGVPLDPEPLVLETWSKRLPRSDAQRPINGNPLGHLAFTSAGNGVNPRTYFRRVLFAKADWMPYQTDRETANVLFTVSGIEGAPEKLVLSVDHTPRWEAGQGNRATSLRWGDILYPILRTQVDLVGKLLTIEVLSSGEFRLRVN
jgi:hypothetical protein